MVPPAALLQEKKERERGAIIARAEKQKLEQREEVRLVSWLLEWGEGRGRSG